MKRILLFIAVMLTAMYANAKVYTIVPVPTNESWATSITSNGVIFSSDNVLSLFVAQDANSGNLGDYDSTVEIKMENDATITKIEVYCTRIIFNGNGWTSEEQEDGTTITTWTGSAKTVSYDGRVYASKIIVTTDEPDDLDGIGSVVADGNEQTTNGKFIQNGRVIIVKNGVKYDVLGRVAK